MTTRRVPQRYPQRQTLPLHAATQFAVRAANRIVGLSEESRPDGVGAGGHQRGPALETGNGILLNRQRVQLGA